jgi:hypothetical protein
VLHLAAERDCRTMITVGGDGILRIWEWSYTTLGLKEAQQVSIDADAELEVNATYIEEQRKQLHGMPVKIKKKRKTIV